MLLLDMSCSMIFKDITWDTLVKSLLLLLIGDEINWATVQGVSDTTLPLNLRPGYASMVMKAFCPI